MKKIMPLVLLVFALQACKKQDLNLPGTNSENLVNEKLNGLPGTKETATFSLLTSITLPGGAGAAEISA